MLPAIPEDRTYLRPHQLEDLERTRDSLTRQMQNPTIEDKGALRRRLVDVNRAIAEDSPPTLTGADLDEAVAEEKRLRAEITEGMPSAEEMRRAPDGAVQQEIRLNSLPRIRKIVRWRNLRLMIHPGDRSDSVCDLEQFRPRSSHLGMASAQVPSERGYFFSPQSEEYRQGYDRVYPPGPEGETTGERIARLEAELKEAKFRAANERAAAARPAGKVPNKAPGPEGLSADTPQA